MRREWVYFDYHTIRGEFAVLPDKDRAKLLALMEHYSAVRAGNPAPAQIDDYGDGIQRLRHIKSAYQGRVLFLMERKADLERLVVLTVYKKQTREVPANVLERARARMIEYRRSRENK